MSECKHCGVDAQDLLSKLRRHLNRLDMLIWRYEFQDEER